MHSEVQETLQRSVERVLVDHCGTALQRQCDAGQWPQALWQLLETLGLTHAMAPESAGGAGLDFSSVMPLIGLAAEHGLPLPLAETVLAHWLVGSAALEPIDGPVALVVAQGKSDWQLVRNGTTCSVTGTVARVPWGRHAHHAVMIVPDLDGEKLLVVGMDHTRIEQGANLAGEPRDTLEFVKAPVRQFATAPITADALLLVCAAVRAVQIAGACSRAVSLTADYANVRVQFGRPIGKLQIIQQYLAFMAGQSAAAAGAASLGVAGVGREINEFSIACAKARAGEAGGQVAALAHQVFGAIGFTREHPLHLLTRRLWSWREEFGTESHWCERLGRIACAGGGRALWPLLAE